MKRIILFAISLSVICIVSCNKDNNDTPPPVKGEFFKLVSITATNLRSPTMHSYTNIVIDSVNNTIILKNRDDYNRDSSIETYHYNNNNQLVLYEHEDTYNNLYISRMEFVRNANGELTKVLSQYKNGLMPSSEGICRNEKRGDTTIITFIDSTHKHKQYYQDAEDYYQVAITNNNRIEYYKSYRKKQAGLTVQWTNLLMMLVVI